LATVRRRRRDHAASSRIDRVPSGQPSSTGGRGRVRSTRPRVPTGRRFPGTVSHYSPDLLWSSPHFHCREVVRSWPSPTYSTPAASWPGTPWHGAQALRILAVERSLPRFFRARVGRDRLLRAITLPPFLLGPVTVYQPVGASTATRCVCRCTPASGTVKREPRSCGRLAARNRVSPWLSTTGPRTRPAADHARTNDCWGLRHPPRVLQVAAAITPSSIANRHGTARCGGAAALATKKAQATESTIVYIPCPAADAASQRAPFLFVAGLPRSGLLSSFPDLPTFSLSPFTFPFHLRRSARGRVALTRVVVGRRLYTLRPDRVAGARLRPACTFASSRMPHAVPAVCRRCGIARACAGSAAVPPLPAALDSTSTSSSRTCSLFSSSLSGSFDHERPLSTASCARPGKISGTRPARPRRASRLGGCAGTRPVPSTASNRVAPSENRADAGPGVRPRSARVEVLG